MLPRFVRCSAAVRSLIEATPQQLSFMVKNRGAILFGSGAFFFHNEAVKATGTGAHSVPAAVTN